MSFEQMVQAPCGVEFRDDKICDMSGCDNVASQKCCSQCKVRVYCSRECQVAAWKGCDNQASPHKEECKYLKACQKAPLSKLPEIIMMDGEEGTTTVGFCKTVSHGAHFYIMEKYEYHGTESNRQVVIADTDQISTQEGIVSCIAEACMHPAYDTVAGMGARRPASVLIYASTFPCGEDDPMVQTVAKLYSRFGSKTRILSFDSNNTMNNREMEDGINWNFSWFCCQKNWNGEITDPLFSTLIDQSRRKPLPMNGMARRGGGVEKRDKEIPRLDPANYPSCQSILRLPFDKKMDQMVVVGGSDGMLYVMDHSRGKLLYRQKLRLARNRRPHAEDVLLCIYKAIVKHGKRPIGITIGQPSVCVLQDVEPYEVALDNKVCKNMCMLGQRQWAENCLVREWIPYWRNTGQYDRAGDDD